MWHSTLYRVKPENRTVSGSAAHSCSFLRILFCSETTCAERHRPARCHRPKINCVATSIARWRSRARSKAQQRPSPTRPAHRPAPRARARELQRRGPGRRCTSTPCISSHPTAASSRARSEGQPQLARRLAPHSLCAKRHRHACSDLPRSVVSHKTPDASIRPSTATSTRRDRAIAQPNGSRTARAAGRASGLHRNGPLEETGSDA